MIFDLFIVSLMVPLLILREVLAVITWAMPSEVSVALTQFFSYLGYWNGIVPIFADATSTGLHRTIGLVDIGLWALTVTTVIYLIRLFVFLIRITPFFDVHGSSTDIIPRR